MRRPPTVELKGSPETLKEKLDELAVSISDIWLPTRGEMIRWQDSDKRYFVRWTRSNHFEMGLRQETMAAARLSPLWAFTLQTGAGGLSLLVQQRFPRFTRNLLVGFGLCQLVWGVVAVDGWWSVWLGTSLVLILTVWLAWTVGHKALRQAWPDLKEALSEHR
jgi:hypothetical protein